MPAGIGYGGKSKVGTMDKPTGPSGILSSSRPQMKPAASGGGRTMGSKKGLVSSQMKRAIGKR